MYKSYHDFIRSLALSAEHHGMKIRLTENGRRALDPDKVANAAGYNLLNKLLSYLPTRGREVQLFTKGEVKSKPELTSYQLQSGY